MAYVVLQAFQDAETGKVYQPNDSYPANKKKERIAALLSEDINDHPSFLTPLLKTVEDDNDDGNEKLDEDVDDQPDATDEK